MRALIAAFTILTFPAMAMVAGAPAPQLQSQALMVLGSKGSFCSAVVLKPDVLLTAGHCVTGSSDYRVHWRDKDGTPVLKVPRAIAVHPGFAKDAAQARKRSIDLALVQLDEALPTTFEPISYSSLAPRSGDTLTVAGYGLTRENDPASSGTFRAAKLSVIEPYGPSSILVWLSDPATGAKAAGAGACTGDSGGPIFDEQQKLVALTIYAEGVGKARCGALTQGLLIAPQRAFIDATLKKWGR